MNLSNQVNTKVSGDVKETASLLMKLYFMRAAFSVIWVIAVSTLAKTSVAFATILFIIYPAWDVIATYFDIRANSRGGNKVPQYVNVLISSAATVGVILALQKGITEAIIVFGIWAILTGLIQSILGLRRRKQLGGQWPMIISGGQSILAGVVFIATANQPNQGINSLAGYAAFGAFYFLLAALRLRSAK
jgi:uncharacterized membrane protein HdeD (DUF308 family)